MSDEETGRDPKTGLFLKGKKGGPGRPKGSSRQDLAREFILSMQKAWQQHGDAVLDRLVTEDPASVLRAMVAIMPKEIDLNVNRYDEMSIEQLRHEWSAAIRDARALGLDLGLGGAQGVH
jgi:hypothetical protein